MYINVYIIMYMYYKGTWLFGDNVTYLLNFVSLGDFGDLFLKKDFLPDLTVWVERRDNNKIIVIINKYIICYAFQENKKNKT